MRPPAFNLACSSRSEAAVNARVRPFIAGIRDACGQFGVKRLAIFGSSTQTQPGVVPRDLDVAVRFDAADLRPPSDLYFGLSAELERLTGLPVDLVETDAIRNPYLKDEIARTEVVLHEEP